MKSMTKREKSIWSIAGIIAVLYSVCFFLVPFKKIPSSCFSYVFTLIAIVYGGLVATKLLNEDEDLRSKFYGFPLIRVYSIYAIIQFSYGIINYILGNFINVPIWLSLIVGILCLGFMVVGNITIEQVKEEIIVQETKVQIETNNMTKLKAEISSICEICRNNEVKKELSKLEENIKYSDPVSTSESKTLEIELLSLLEQLYNNINSDSQEILTLIEKINYQLMVRNRVCKESKSKWE